MWPNIKISIYTAEIIVPYLNAEHEVIGRTGLEGNECGVTWFDYLNGWANVCKIESAQNHTGETE